MAFTGRSYKLAACGIVPVLLALSGRTKVLFLGDSDDSFFSGNYEDAGIYRSALPSGGLRGWGRSALLNGSITPIAYTDDNQEAMTVSASIFPWRSDNNPGGGQKYGTLLGATGRVPWGAQSYNKATLTGGLLQHRFDIGPIGGGFFAMGPTCRTPDWYAAATDFKYLWYEPGLNVPSGGYTGGPALAAYWRRDINGGAFQGPLATAAAGSSNSYRSMSGTVPACGPVNISSITAVATPVITTAAVHNLVANTKVVIVNSSVRTSGAAAIDGEYVVATTPTGTTFTVTGMASLSGGTAGTAQGYVSQGPAGRLSLAIFTNAASGSGKAYIPLGIQFENNQVSTGLSMMCLGNPEFRTTDWVDLTSVPDAALDAFLTTFGPFDAVVSCLGKNLTSGLAADGTANDELGTLVAGNTATFKANAAATTASGAGGRARNEEGARGG